MPWQLVLLDREHRGAHLLDRSSMIVGSGPDCDVRIPDLTVSRRHAALLVDDEKLALEDLGSRNGTRRAGVRLADRVRLADGDEIAFGSVVGKVHEIVAGDVRPAVRFDDPSTPPGKPPTFGAATTLSSGSLHELLSLGLPALLRDLADGCTLAEMAPRVGRLALDALPAVRVRILRPGRGGSGALHGVMSGVLFTGEAGESGETGAATAHDHAVTVVAERSDLVLEIVFALAGQARGFRPLVEGLADLLRASRRGPRSPRPLADEEDPPLPSPPTLDPVVRRLYEEARRVAKGDVSVLVRGESGTGKEVLARYLHAASPRRSGPFVALNCAALPRDLLESELFGVEVGVATGVRARPGKFELADGGTLFLDEIGDMAAATQARILRVLQESEVYRLGGAEPRSANVRILAATNRDLEEMRSAGTFRDDLYHRIADWVVELPPLRRRRRDIPNLAAFFLLRESDRRGVRAAGISEAAMAALAAHPWPGNVRQLEREMARAALFLEAGDLLQLRHLQPELRNDSRPPAAVATGTLQEVVEEAERRAIEDALQREGGNMTAAAKTLGIGRTTLYRRVKELGIEA